MIKLQRLGHVLIAVRDLEKSKDFYTRVLGFKVLEEDPEHGGVFLSIGGLGNTLDLFQCTNLDAVAPSQSNLGVRHTAFAVDCFLARSCDPCTFRLLFLPPSLQRIL